jgi:hypothetical protein
MSRCRLHAFNNYILYFSTAYIMILKERLHSFCLLFFILSNILETLRETRHWSFVRFVESLVKQKIEEWEREAQTRATREKIVANTKIDISMFVSLERPSTKKIIRASVFKLNSRVSFLIQLFSLFFFLLQSFSR